MEEAFAAAPLGAVISACSRTASWEAALSALSWGRLQSLRPGLLASNAAVSACARSARWREACEMWQGTLRRRGLSPDLVTCGAVLSACGGVGGVGGRWQQATAAVGEAMKSRLRVDVVACGAVLSACAASAFWEQALALLAGAAATALAASVVAANSVATACERGGQWAQALLLLIAMRRLQLRSDATTWNSISSACVGAKQWRQALLMPRRLCQEAGQLDIVSCNGQMASCAEGRQWHSALHLLHELCGGRTPDILPDEFTFTAAIDACRWSWTRTLELLQEMEKRVLRPGLEAYNAAIQACSSRISVGAKAWPLHLLTRMQLDALEPNHLTWQAVIISCQSRCERDQLPGLLDQLQCHSIRKFRRGHAQDKSVKEASWR
ncbi:unnamed protein product [Polarella glacialis]|uniref:Pentatricopeptide repeat-containing protein, chloroplastic n=1 Tax=Polarella glacialis TaxID=89957 RepID=A0A813EC28_POLGL|nr:unnamed protein product [Polarella glacialis]